MKLPKINPKVARSLKKTGLKLKKSSPTILTVIASVGVVATGVLSAKAAPKALKLIEDGKKKEDMTDISKIEVVAIDIKYGWKPFIPAVAAGISTIACIFGANILNKKQQAAITSAYMMLESQYRDYRKKVIERHGEEEDKEIYSEITKANITPLSDIDEKMTFSYEGLDNYFESTMANVSFALNRLNWLLSFNGFVTLGDFYEELGLPTTSEDFRVGWSDVDFLEGWGVVPYIQFNFYDEKKPDGLIVREILLWCEPTAEAIDVLDMDIKDSYLGEKIDPSNFSNSLSQE